MAEVNQKVLTMVEAELKENPDVSSQELFEKAVKIDKSIANLNPRQFNARYPLQVKRRLAPPRPRRATQRGRRVADRQAIRSLLLDFAKKIADSSSPGAVVEVIGNVDEYVEKLVKASGAR